MMVSRGYIAPAIINTDGRVLVNHVISFYGSGGYDILPFDREVANTVYMDGVIVVAGMNLLGYISELEAVAKRYVEDGAVMMARVLSSYIANNYGFDGSDTMLLLYVNMEDGGIVKLC